MTDGEKQAYRDIVNPPTEPSLRNVLARRMCDAFNNEADRMNAEEKETGVPWAVRYPDHGHLWKAVADEVIRQMEWVRHDYLLKRIAEGRHDAPRWAHEVYESVRDGDLTLAPPEWKP